jgi:hypothetical protein
MIQRLFTENIIRRSDWGVLNEMAPYKEPQCTYTSHDWEQLQDSEEYDTLLNMGWIEITSDGQQRKQGNIVFTHLEIENLMRPWCIRINYKGTIKRAKMRPDGKTQDFDIVKEGDPYSVKCAEIKDYRNKIGLIIKYTLYYWGLIKEEEALSQKDYKRSFVDCILNPPPGMGTGTVLKKIGRYLPPSIMDIFIEMEERGELSDNVIQAFVLTDKYRKNR